MAKRMAFLVGINDYGEYSGLPRLNYAEADVKLMAETLETTAGFSTKILLGSEANLDKIARGLHSYYNDNNLDLFLFYFAGHGELIPQVDMHCLHCYNSEMGDIVGALNIQDWASRIKRNIIARRIVLVVDACQKSFYRGARTVDTPGLSPSVSTALQIVSDQAEHTNGTIDTNEYIKQKRRLLFTLLSCGPCQVSFEDDKLKHGIFTFALAKEIKENGHKLPLSKISKKVAEYTIERCRKKHWSPQQVPEWIGPSVDEDVLLVDALNSILPDEDKIIGRAVSDIYDAHPSPYGTQGYVRRYEKGSFYLLKKVGKPKRKLTKIEDNSSFSLSDSNIEARYESLGGSRSVLGFPIEKVQNAWKSLKETQESLSTVQAFEGGNIYFRKGCGAHTVLKGSIKDLVKESEQDLLEKQDKKATGGVFGFPVSEQMEISSVTKALGHVQRFESGLIIDWSGGVFGIKGKFYDLYQSLGEWTSPLGFTVSNEQPVALSISESTGSMQIFENGCMIWDKKNDRCIYIEGDIFQEWYSNRSKYAFPINNPYPLENGFEQPFEGGKIVIEQTNSQKKTPIKREIETATISVKKEELIAPPTGITSRKSDNLFSLSKKQLDTLRRLHEKISSNLSSLLNFYLSTQMFVKLHSIEGLTYVRFIKSLPARTYMNAISMKPSDKISVLAIESKLLFSMINILNKKSTDISSEKRAIEDMDRGVIGGLVRTILERLEEGWEEITPFNMSVLQTGTSPQSLALLVSSEQVVAISFELTVGGGTGFMHFCIPNALLQSISDKTLTKHRMQ